MYKCTVICAAPGAEVSSGAYMGMERGGFLAGVDGKVARVWRTVKPDTDAAEVLEAARTLPAGA